MVVSTGDVSSQSNQAGRRIVTTGAPKGNNSSSNTVHRPGSGIRRVITQTPASQTGNTEGYHTVHLCDLPTNLTLTDITQMVNSAGVGQPLGVDYVSGSRECVITFHQSEVAAKFYQKINRRMVNMSFIRAKMY
nr:uncharacterized protein LOC113800978 [Penaeus vannamei]